MKSFKPKPTAEMILLPWEPQMKSDFINKVWNQSIVLNLTCWKIYSNVINMIENNPKSYDNFSVDMFIKINKYC